MARGVAGVEQMMSRRIKDNKRPLDGSAEIVKLSDSERQRSWCTQTYHPVAGDLHLECGRWGSCSATYCWLFALAAPVLSHIHAMEAISPAARGAVGGNPRQHQIW